MIFMILEEFLGYNDPKNPQYGVYKFKKGFNGDFVEFANEFYIVFKPITNFIYNFCVNVYNKFYKFVHN